MLKNIIFDFGQVIVRFDEAYMTGAFVDDPADVAAVKAVAFDRLYWDRLDEGTITDEEVRAGIRSRLPERLQVAACEAFDRWMENLPFIEGMPALIEELQARGKHLFLLSNISKGFAARYPEVPALAELLGCFDGLVFSGPLGLVKPGPAIFHHLLKTYGLKPEECLFIDDRASNVAGAEAVGIRGYHFDGDVSKLRRFLKE